MPVPLWFASRLTRRKWNGVIRIGSGATGAALICHAFAAKPASVKVKVRAMKKLKDAAL